MDNMEARFRSLVEAPAISGFEKNVRDLLKKELKPHVDSIKVDKVGNLIAVKGSGSPKIMFAAHMDELGLIVKYVGKDGFIKFETVGGWDERILPGIKVKIHGSKGAVTGVVGTKSIHLQDKDEAKKPLKAKELSIDIGAKSAKEVDGVGVKIGDFITNYGQLDRLVGSRMTAYGCDDRIGCLELIEIAKNVKSFKGTLYLVGTIEEEIGLVGARGSMFGINPDAMISLDVTLVGDTPDAKPGDVPTKLGDGPVMEIRDAISFINPQVRKWVNETAKSNKVPLQKLVLNAGAQDSSVAAMVREGIPSGGVSVPSRYLHTPVEVFDMDDVKQSIKLLSEMVKSAHKYF
jgi:endoglucanase